MLYLSISGESKTKKVNISPSKLIFYLFVSKYVKLFLKTGKNSFKYESKKDRTKLSNYVWDKKKDKQEISFKWYIKGKGKAYSPAKRRCMLCLGEKFHILFFKERLLNKQIRIISKCRHGNKHKLSNYKIQLNEGKCYKETNQFVCFAKYEIGPYGFNELMYFW